jgi:predicted DNA-binding antitoxin AbrB/MazE fold protein
MVQIDAVYENGILRPAAPLSLPEGQRVTIQIVPRSSATEQMYGILPWNGDSEELHRFLNDTEEGQWTES